MALTPAIDRSVTVERLVPGSVHRPRGGVSVPGGKGLNVARAAAALGGEVSAVATLAGDAGRWIAAGLEREGMPARIAWMDGETRTCLSVADASNGKLTEFYDVGGPTDATAWEELVGHATELAAVAGWVVISGSVPEGLPPGSITELVAGAREAGARVALDTHGPGLPAGLAAGPELVKVNAHEASEVAPDTGGRHSQAMALQELAGGDGHAAVVTHGTDGLMLVDERGAAARASVEAVGPYPVGSGDAALAGIAVALDRGEPWEAALRLSVGAAAANAELIGAGRLAPARARELAARAAVSVAD